MRGPLSPTHPGPGRTWPPHGLPCLSAVLAAALLLPVVLGGCGGVRAREPRLRNTLADWRERIETARGPSEASGAVLARHGLIDGAEDDPAGTARLLETRLERRPEPDGALALAELSYRAGLGREDDEPASALTWYRDAASLASLALAEPSSTNRELAVDLHNRALARLIRVAQAHGARDGQSWREVLGERGMAVGSPSPFLAPERLGALRVAGDLRIEGMNHVYRTSGLGVPVIARRQADPSSAPDAADRFLPTDLRAGATAVVMPGGGLSGGDWRRHPTSLVLFDPFVERSVAVGAQDVPLAGDRTAPLAVQVARGQLASLEWMGLLQSSFGRPGLTGLYMLRPYEPGKIPVVLVHGLFSSPRAFVQAVNELRNTPELADRYQFWVFLYPTGLPIPTSASRLRRALADARESLDPGRTDGALDRMVLVGHSMGGLLSKMMVQDSGLVLWDATIRIPYGKFRSSPRLRESIDEVLVYHPLPCVRRVVFIASPHRGSPIANELVGRIVSRLVRRPDEMTANVAELEQLNGPDVMAPELHGIAPNAIGNLRTDNPILAALDRIPIDPTVPYHSIIPMIGGFAGTDGVVEYRSSHLAGARSERIVSGTHSSQQKPEVIQELRRILLEHLAGDGESLAASDPD